jgi:glycosyltransferase involved in cell wall biosynthesis
MSSAGPSVRHLAIEATRLLQEWRGIGRYVRNLLREFAEQRSALRFTFFVDTRDAVEAMRRYLDTVHPTLNTRSWIETIDRLPSSDADVVWYPWNFVTTPARVGTMVVTVHDIAPMLQLDHRWWKLIKRAKYRARFRRTTTLAHAIVTDSAFSRDELVRWLGVEGSRVSVTALAADDLPLTVADEASSLERCGVAGPFFLCVGGQDARKNLRTLYEAMDHLWARGVHIPLVQCGPAPARETRNRLRRSPWLQHVGYVSDAQLVWLYRHCTALMFPSRYEGFGLPVLEAMRAGAPVICSGESSLPEVAGNAAQYVAWHDARAMGDAMQRLADTPAERERLRAAGRHRADLFTWAATARETLLAFERAMISRGVLLRPAPEPSAALAAPAVIGAAPGLHGAHDA